MSYKKLFTLSIIAFLFISFSASIAQEKPMKQMDHHKMEMKAKTMDIASIDKNGDGKVYGCAMCGEFSDEDGSCSECGMHYALMSVEDAKAKIADGMHKSHSMSVASFDKNGDGKVYGCAMCGEFSDEDGSCSECGMHYTLMSVKDAEAKMAKGMHKKHSASVASFDKNGDGKVYGCAMCGEFSDEDGSCSECGMHYTLMSVKEAEKKMESMKDKMHK